MIRISQSEIELYKADQWHWYFQCYEGYTSKAGNIGTALSFGSAVHEGLEAWYKSEDPYGRIYKYYRNMEIPPDKRKLAIEERSLASEVVDRYIIHYYGDSPYLDDMGTIESVEEKLVYEYAPGIQVIGKCDLITDRGIVDHKSTKILKTDYQSSYLPRHQGRFYLWLLEKTSGRWRGEFVYNMLKKGVPSNRTRPDTVWFHREHLYYGRQELHGFGLSLEHVISDIVSARRRLDTGEDFRNFLYPTHDPTSYRTNIYQDHYPMLWETWGDPHTWREIFNENYAKHDPLERYND